MGTPQSPARPARRDGGRCSSRRGRSRRVQWAVVIPLLASIALLGLTTGCSGDVEGGRAEVHPEVETLYDQAARSSVAEVPGSELVEIVLRHTGGKPVWRSTVVTSDGTAHTVTVAATTGDILKKSLPGTVEPASERTMMLLGRTALLPEEAAREVTTPDFGKVTRVSLGKAEGRPVWLVDVTTVEEVHVRRTAVDAVTGETVESTPLPEEAGRHEQG